MSKQQATYRPGKPEPSPDSGKRGVQPTMPRPANLVPPKPAPPLKKNS